MHDEHDNADKVAAYTRLSAAWARMKASTALRDFFGSAPSNHLDVGSSVSRRSGGRNYFQVDDHDLGEVVGRTFHYGGREWTSFCARVKTGSLPDFNFGITPD